MKSFRKNHSLTPSNPAIYVLHENDEWIRPLEAALEKFNLPCNFWFINENGLNIADIPPEGVFYNRMSASSHTRDHRYAIELAEPVLTWLEIHGRTIVNGRDALTLEIRKAEQYLRLLKHGIYVPETVVANNTAELLHYADAFAHSPFIVKPNRGGKGTGVRLFNTPKELRDELHANPDVFKSLDGLLILQQYIKPATGHIVRLEFIGGRFYYAVQVDASGGFELCPADECSDDAGSNCPADGVSEKFRILEGYEDPAIPIYEAFMRENDIQIGAIEYVEDVKGDRYVFDVNINTNYNSLAEGATSGNLAAMEEVAAYLGQLLKREQAGKVVLERSTQ